MLQTVTNISGVMLAGSMKNDEMKEIVDKKNKYKRMIV